eukprot:4539265-Pyramimonas_sp.AAC.1
MQGRPAGTQLGIRFLARHCRGQRSPCIKIACKNDLFKVDCSCCHACVCAMATPQGRTENCALIRH